MTTDFSKTSCSDCNFYSEVTGGAPFYEGDFKRPAGECRRHAPSSKLAGPKFAGEMAIAHWPVVAADDWCGDFEGKPAAVAPIAIQQAPDIPAAKKRAPRSIKKKAS